MIDLPNFDRIERVSLYKRDEVTTDLICCDVALIGGAVLTFHEEWSGWASLLAHVSKLPGFRDDWPSNVVQPPFSANVFIAFERR